MQSTCNQGNSGAHDATPLMSHHGGLDWGTEVLFEGRQLPGGAQRPPGSCGCSSCGGGDTGRPRTTFDGAGPISLMADVPLPDMEHLRQETARLVAGFLPSLDALSHQPSPQPHAHKSDDIHPCPVPRLCGCEVNESPAALARGKGAGAHPRSGAPRSAGAYTGPRRAPPARRHGSITNLSLPNWMAYAEQVWELQHTPPAELPVPRTIPDWKCMNRHPVTPSDSDRCDDYCRTHFPDTPCVLSCFWKADRDGNCVLAATCTTCEEVPEMEDLSDISV